MSAPFFIGWQSLPPPGLRRFIGGLALALMAGAGVLALALGSAADDPAGPAFAAPPEPLPDSAAMEGVLTARPYPLLHLDNGRAILLAEEGKYGAMPAAGLVGQRVAAEGYVLARGDIAMLVLGAELVVRPGPAPAPPVERLGRWRITGEICDGKCAAGAMRPGTGLGHRACATLCLDGELPAVFVATAPVGGSVFLLLGGADGGPMPAALRPRIGQRITLEGAVERRGGILVFLAEPSG